MDFGSLNGMWRITANQFKAGKFDIITTVNGKKHVKQEQALKILTDNETKRFCYGGAAGGAKSWTGCCWLMFSALVYPETRWFVGRKELGQIEQSTVPTFDRVAKTYGVIKDKDYKYNANKHTITFSNGSVIVLLNLEYEPGDPNFDRLGSTEYTGGWIEEAAAVHAKAYDTLASRLGRWYNDKYGLIGKMFITTNPTKNWVYDTFYYPSKIGSMLAGYVFLQAFVYDNPHVEKDYATNLEMMGDKVQRARLLEGDFEYSENDLALVTPEQIEACFDTGMAMMAEGDSRLSADIAMLGRDKYVCGLWKGDCVTIVSEFDKCKGPDIQHDIEKWMNRYDIPHYNVTVDSDGLGSYLEGYINDINMFHGNEASTDPIEYANMKTQCAYLLAEKIIKNKLCIICNDRQRAQIRQELALLQVKSTGRDEQSKKLISKDEMKKIINRSPDYLDMLIMGQYEEAKAWDIGVIY